MLTDLKFSQHARASLGAKMLDIFRIRDFWCGFLWQIANSDSAKRAACGKGIIIETVQTKIYRVYQQNCQHWPEPEVLKN